MWEMGDGRPGEMEPCPAGGSDVQSAEEVKRQAAPSLQARVRVRQTLIAQTTTSLLIAHSHNQSLSLTLSLSPSLPCHPPTDTAKLRWRSIHLSVQLLKNDLKHLDRSTRLAAGMLYLGFLINAADCSLAAPGRPLQDQPDLPWRQWLS